MPASLRGAATRIPFDFYPTPPWLVDRLLDRHASDLGFGRELNAPRLLEPTVGDGAIVRAVDGWIARTPHYEMEHAWTGVELRRDALLPETDLEVHVEGQDFRTWDPWEAGPLRRADSTFRKPPPDEPFVWEDELFDGGMGNPPFSIAEAIIRRALELSRWTAMLLRVGFLGSEDRLDFWRGPAADPWVRVIPDRPSFDGIGTDSATYAWFVWGDVDLVGPRVDVLDHTPASVRSAYRPALPTGLPQLGLDL